MKSFNKYILISLLIISIIFLFSVNNRTEPGKVIEAVPEVVIQLPGCKPQKNICTLSAANVLAEIKIDKDVTYLKPFKMDVRIDKSVTQDIKSIHIDFKMKSMDMGINRFKLNSKAESDKYSNWEGKALLPMCVTGRADWFAEVEILTHKEKYIFSFPMDVKKAR